MKQHRHAPEVEAELDGIWYHIATKSGSVEIADRVIETSLNVSGCWPGILTSAVDVMTICAPACVASQRMITSSSTASKMTVF
jgi:hypothetical protein